MTQEFKIVFSGKDEILAGLTGIIYLEDGYKLYNELDESYNTPWSLYYDLTAARFQTERPEINRPSVSKLV